MDDLIPGRTFRFVEIVQIDGERRLAVRWILPPPFAADARVGSNSPSPSNGRICAWCSLSDSERERAWRDHSTECLRVARPVGE